MKKGFDHSDAARKKMSQTRQQHPELGPMTDEELSLFRADPQLEKSRRISDYVVCRECGARIAHLVAHLRQHGITTKQYREKWPHAPLSSAKVRKKLRESMAAKRRAHPENFKKQRRDYYNRNHERLIEQRRTKEGQLPREDFLKQIRRESRGTPLPFPQPGLPLPEPPSEKGGRPKESDENRRYFKIGQMLKRRLPLATN
jgi:hypothetical protein